ncbi:MAG: hypothetical protein Q7R65_01570 [bacterium]|nr:hypothetical protein [bacterium]
MSKHYSVIRTRSDKHERFADGNVPNANWNGDKFYVNNGYHPDNANPNLRTRVEISRNKGAYAPFCV